MQTFLPHLGFSASAKCLDDKRLGKQRVETKQIYLALTNPDYGWQHHPAVTMWRGHEVALLWYGAIICHEWRSRGFKDTLLPWFNEQIAGRSIQHLPPWLGNDAFHASHQSNLCRKAPWHYRQFFPEVNMSLPYVWPSP
jgi:hypothetical protein